MERRLALVFSDSVEKSILITSLRVRGSGEKPVKVVAVSDKYESELGLPIEKFKKVIRKA